VGDHIGVQLLVLEIYRNLTHHPGQLSLAIPQWVDWFVLCAKGGDALQLESKGRYGSCLVAGKTL